MGFGNRLYPFGFYVNTIFIEEDIGSFKISTDFDKSTELDFLYDPLADVKKLRQI